MARRTTEPRVFFPWEARRGLFGAFGRRQIRFIAGVVVLLAVVVLLLRREEHAAAVRATRAVLTRGGDAVAAYRADHGGSCPRAMADLVSAGYLHDPLVDAWGRPLRLVCPGRKDPLGFDLSSDGPDGIPGGLDRVE